MKLLLLFNYFIVTFAGLVCNEGLIYSAVIDNHNSFQDSCELCRIRKISRNVISCESYGIAECIKSSITILYDNDKTCDILTNITTILTDLNFPISLLKQKYPIGHDISICVNTNNGLCSFSHDFQQNTNLFRYYLNILHDSFKRNIK